jgi:hypothetical protein
MQRLLKSQRIGDPDKGDTGRSAEIEKHLSNVLMQLRVISHLIDPPYDSFIKVI